MPVQIINHKNKEIILVDHKTLKGAEMIDCFKEASAEILKRKNTALSLADFTGVEISKEFIEYLKSDEVKPITQCVKKEAIIGVVEDFYYGTLSSEVGPYAFRQIPR